MAKNDTVYVQVRGFVEWAKVFEFNRDLTSSHRDVQKMLNQTEGLYKVDFYPANEEEKQKLVDAGLSEDLFGGGKRWAEGNKDLGLGIKTQFKRKHKDEHETKKGVRNFGGPVEVVWYDTLEKFDPETSGLIGNGSEVMLKVSIFGTGTSQTVRLEKIGVIELVEYRDGNAGGF